MAFMRSSGLQKLDSTTRHTTSRGIAGRRHGAGALRSGPEGSSRVIAACESRELTYGACANEKRCSLTLRARLSASSLSFMQQNSDSRPSRIRMLTSNPRDQAIDISRYGRNLDSRPKGRASMPSAQMPSSTRAWTRTTAARTLSTSVVATSDSRRCVAKNAPHNSESTVAASPNKIKTRRVMSCRDPKYTGLRLGESTGERRERSWSHASCDCSSPWTTA